MTRLEDAVRDVLRNPPVRATVPADPLRVLEGRMRRVRRARVLLGAGFAVAAALAVLGVAVLVASASHDPAPATTGRPPPAAVEAAARSLLTHVEAGYTVTRPAEWVRTTGRAYGRLVGSIGADLDREVYVVQLHGRFTCEACPGPLGAKAPTGTAAFSMFPIRGQGESSFGVGPPLDLTQLGPVHTFPVS
jgi:hypothetical protein